MARRLYKTTADYLVIAVSPALIMALVASLVFFLLEAFYRGGFQGRLQYILFLFVFAAVLIARIAMEEGRERAMVFSVFLAVAVALTLSRFSDLGMIANLGLIALIWWCADRLTWDCTLIDEHENASGEGLLQTVGLDDPSDGERNGDANADVEPLGVTSRDAEPERTTWWRRVWEHFHGRRPPGVWVVYFSLAALPIFGFGHHFLPDDESRRAGFRYLLIYVGSALGLLMTTCFLGLRRYLRQRKVEMPDQMAVVWVATGCTLIVALLIFCTLLPRRNPVLAVVSEAPFEFGSPDDLRPSWLGWGEEGVKDDEKSGEARQTDEQDSSDDQQDRGESGDEQSNGEQGSSGGESKRQNSGGEQGEQQGQGSQSSDSQSEQSSQSQSGSQGKRKSNGGGDQDQQGNGSSNQGQQGKSKQGQQGQSRQGQQGESQQGNQGESQQGRQGESQQSGSDQSSQQQQSKSKDRSQSSSSAQRQQQGDQRQDSQQPKSQQADAASQSQQAEQQPAPQEPRSNTPSRQPFNPWNAIGSLFGWLGALMKLAFYAALLAVATWLFVKYKDEVMAGFRDLFNDFRKLWERLFGRKEPEPEVEQAPVDTGPRYRPFASYPDPFASGKAGRYTPEQLVKYSFEAFEAWAREQGCPRHPEQTPYEFAQAIAAKNANLAKPARALAELYSRLAYAPGPLPPTTLEYVRQLWAALRS